VGKTNKSAWNSLSGLLDGIMLAHKYLGPRNVAFVVKKWTQKNAKPNWLSTVLNKLTQ
jgi:hypothetical protein